MKLGLNTSLFCHRKVAFFLFLLFLFNESFMIGKNVTGNTSVFSSFSKREYFI